MGFTTSDFQDVRAVMTGLQIVFNEAYVSALSTGSRTLISTEIPSDSDAEDYAWLGDVPGVREFIEERQLKGLSDYSYTIKNKTWENSLGIDRATFEDDKYGMLKLRIQDLAVRAAQYQDALVFKALREGFTGTAYDSLAFFSDSHTGADNLSTAALSADAVQDAISAMMMFTSDTGELLNITPTHLVVPPDLQWTAMEILESVVNPDATAATYAAKTANNVLKGKLQLVVSPYLGGTAALNNNWYILDCSKPIKPVIFQSRVPVTMEMLGDGSEIAFMQDRIAVGSRGRYNVGYGLYQMAYGSTGGS